MTLLGIPADVIDGPILRNRNGFTDMREVEQAVTVARSHVFISKEATLSPRNIAGHEAFHLWKSGAGREAYIEALEENLDFSGEAFRTYQSDIALTVFGQEADLTDETMMERFTGELYAYISGDIHEGTNEAALRPMFRDFDAVRAAWENLVEENRGGTTRSRYSRKDLMKEEEGALLRYKSGESYQINAKLRDGVSLTEMEQQFVDQLDTALEKMPLHDGTVYRRLSFDMEGQEVLEAFLAEHEAGEIVGYSAYTSSSVSESGYPVDGEPTVTQIIESHTGRDLEGVGNNFEREVLFPRQSYFYIQSVEVDNRGNTIIHMEEVTENGAGQLYSEERGRTVQQVRPEKSDQMQNVSGRDSQESSVQQPMSGLRAEGDGEEGGITRESRKGFSVDRELDREIRQIVKEAREGGRSEEAVQADVRALVRRLTGAEKRAAQTAEGKLSAALKAGAKRAETLRERQGDGTMESRYSRKEDGTNGADGQERQFPEGAGPEEAVRRFYAEAEGRGQTVRVFQRNGQTGRGARSRLRLGRFTEVTADAATETAVQTKADLEALGIPAFIHAGDLEVMNKNGEILRSAEDSAVWAC